MSVTINVRGLTTDGYQFRTSPLAELAAILHVILEPDHHTHRTLWAAGVSVGIDSVLLQRIAASSVLWRSSRADFLLPGSPHGNLAQELDDVDQLADEMWVDAALFTTSCGSVPMHPARNILSSNSAREEALKRAQSRGIVQADFVARILVDPPAMRRWVRQLLEECDAAFFADEWRRLLPRLTADARHKTDLLERHGLASALSAVSPAIALDDKHHRLVVDKLQDQSADAPTGVTFLPSDFGNPHLLIVHAPGWKPVIQYPASAPETPPPSGVLEDRLRCFAHPVKMRLLRTLARGPHTTSELAEAWNLSTPEVSRHLAHMKSAGILTSRRRGRFVMYQLDLGTTAKLGTDIIDALLL